MRELYLNKDKTLLCPRCKKYLTTVDKRRTDYVKISCKKCKKWIWIRPFDDDYKIYDIPKRQDSSGKRFY